MLKRALITVAPLPDWALFKIDPETRAQLDAESIVSLRNVVLENVSERRMRTYGGTLFKMPSSNYVAVLAKPMRLTDTKAHKYYKTLYGGWIFKYMKVFNALGVEPPKPVVTWGAVSEEKLSPTIPLRAIILDYAYLVSKKREVERELELLKRVHTLTSKIYAALPGLEGKIDILLLRSDADQAAAEKQLEILGKVFEGVGELLARSREQHELLQQLAKSVNRVKELLETAVPLLEEGQVEAAKALLKRAEKVVEEAAAKTESAVPEFVRENPWLELLSGRT